MQHNTKTMPMTTPDLKSLTYELWAQFNAHDMSNYDQVIAPTFVNCEAAEGTPCGPEGQRQVSRRLYEAFPDMRFEIEEVFVSGNRVAALGWMSGTQQGRFGPFPPTHKSFRVQHMQIFRFDQDSRLLEHSAVRDDLSMLQQLGHIPQ